MHTHIIYSPAGEKFEVTKANFDDLQKHYNWTPNPPETSVAAIVAATNEDTANGEGQDSPAVPAEGQEGSSGSGEEGPGQEDAAEEEVVLDEKAALIAKLKEDHGFDADKRWNVTKLKTKLDELAAA